MTYVTYATYLTYVEGKMAVDDPVRFESYSEARTHLKILLDAAADGRPALVRRGSGSVAVVDTQRLRGALGGVVTRAEVVAEAGGWSVFIPGVPVAADGATLDEAVEEMVDALREYAADWESRLRGAVNHARHWSLVQLIAVSDDDELRAWLVGDW